MGNFSPILENALAKFSIKLLRWKTGRGKQKRILRSECCDKMDFVIVFAIN